MVHIRTSQICDRSHGCGQGRCFYWCASSRTASMLHISLQFCLHLFTHPTQFHVCTYVFSSCGELVRRRTCSQKNLVLPTRGVRSSVRSCNVSLAVNYLVCRVATGEEPKKVETADKCVGESIWGDAFLWQTIFDLPPF